MRAAQCAAALACVLLAPAVAGCELVLREHRSGRMLQRVALAEPGVSIAFEHSVLGTTVIDRYEFRPHAVLIEERFDGQGYGLPYAAGPGERLTRNAQGSRLELERSVDPLVVRPLPAQRMRLLLPSGPLWLGELTTQAIQIHAVGCFPAGIPSSRRKPGSTAMRSAAQRVDPGFRRDDAAQRKRAT